MSISKHFGNAQQWAHTHFGGVGLGDVRRNRRAVTLATGWAREPRASIPRLSRGQAYASKAAYQLLGHAQATSEALQATHRQYVEQQLQAPCTFLLVEDTTESSWPEAAERRSGLEPVGPGKATSQGVLRHSLVAAAWPAVWPRPGRQTARAAALGPARPAVPRAPARARSRKSSPLRQFPPAPETRARVGSVGAAPAGRR